jgi:hypothetical protein
VDSDKEAVRILCGAGAKRFQARIDAKAKIKPILEPFILKKHEAAFEKVVRGGRKVAAGLWKKVPGSN